MGRVNKKTKDRKNKLMNMQNNMQNWSEYTNMYKENHEYD
jgi:hypothetical protein